ncbi:carbon-nitrogen hydrolase family protein [Cryobacterium sp. TMS1-13-1]|uniref:carbon-nitrogen hydrolase family protein n=1 Tax=Cryobacterium sp. TMS1-13-1 TaxID=1259220 RepID=UPI00106C5038|nr:carbon-nitrogen hydrolase family protein [Cryobacterium sp. TMS1-13-1]TFD23283.1 carbon-nitrogen hydrolase family protein [Cryobacterium sp. TMS1-13-1]
MRVSLAQIESGTNKLHNLALMQQTAQRAAAEGANLVVFPEYAMYEKKSVDASFAVAAEPVTGPFVRALAAIAVALHITLVAGIVETNENDPRPFNTIVVLSPDGVLQAQYRKMHLFDSFGFRESEWISPAADLAPVVAEVTGCSGERLRIGLMTCYDLRFPELGRELADAGADLVLVCSSWVPGPQKDDQWRVLAQARAIENSYFVGAVSQCPPISIGRSLLVDPAGRVLGELGLQPGMLTVDVDPDQVRQARQRNPALHHRRHTIQPRT